MSILEDVLGWSIALMACTRHEQINFLAVYI